RCIPSLAAYAAWLVRRTRSRVPAAAGSSSRGNLAVLPRGRRLGHQRPGRLGIRDHQLRLVDWYRPRRNADLRDSPAAEAGLANFGKPLLGSDDAFCGRLRRHVPDSAPWPSVARLLAASVSELDVDVAAAAQPAG